MLSSTYQTGMRGVELLTPSGTGKDQKYAAFLGAITRDYDRTIKGYCYSINQSGTSTMIQCPASPRDALGVIQPLLFLQVECGEEIRSSVEITVLDKRNQRHRLHFSSTFREIESNELHAQIPWVCDHFPSKRWTHVLIDLQYFTKICFRGAEFASLVGFSLKPCIKVRKIFTMPIISEVYYSSETQELTFPIPVNFNFPKGVEHHLHVLGSSALTPKTHSTVNSSDVDQNCSSVAGSASVNSTKKTLSVRGVGFGTSSPRKVGPSASPEVTKVVEKAKTVTNFGKAQSRLHSESSVHKMKQHGVEKCRSTRLPADPRVVARPSCNKKEALLPHALSSSIGDHNKSKTIGTKSSPKKLSSEGLTMPDRTSGAMRYDITDEDEAIVEGNAHRSPNLLEQPLPLPHELTVFTLMTAQVAQTEEHVITDTADTAAVSRIDDLVLKIKQASMDLSVVEKEFAQEFGSNAKDELEASWDLDI